MKRKDSKKLIEDSALFIADSISRIINKYGEDTRKKFDNDPELKYLEQGILENLVSILEKKI